MNHVRRDIRKRREDAEYDMEAGEGQEAKEDASSEVYILVLKLRRWRAMACLIAFAVT